MSVPVEEVRRAILRHTAAKWGGQKELAEELGCSRHHISETISGKRYPSAKICLRFGFIKKVKRRGGWPGKPAIITFEAINVQE